MLDWVVQVCERGHVQGQSPEAVWQAAPGAPQGQSHPARGALPFLHQSRRPAHASGRCSALPLPDVAYCLYLCKGDFPSVDGVDAAATAAAALAAAAAAAAASILQSHTSS